MSRLPQPDLRPVEGGYLLHGGYVYEWGARPEGLRVIIRYRLTVPPGGRPQSGEPWDGASVPRILWWFIPPDGTHRAAALVHDLLYCMGGRVNGLHEKLEDDLWQAVGQDWTREQADRMFLRLCREGGLARWKRRMAYRALRWFGSGAWRD